MPKVSVVMSVFNGARTLREAVDSILSQTFTDFEFIIIDDGSTDGTWGILNGYDDPRIRLLRNEENIGLTRSLNKGLALVQGEYIARMDADDISLPERLERQVDCLDSRPEVGVVGTNYWELTPTNERRPMVVPLTDMSVRLWLLFHNAIVHSSAMVRRTTLEQIGYYDEALPYAQDYDLWTRVAVVSELANLPDRLLLLRTGVSAGVSVGCLQQQQFVADSISRRVINDLLERPELSLRQVQRLRRFVQPLMAGSHSSIDAQALNDFVRVVRRFMTLYTPIASSGKDGMAEIEAWLLDVAWSCVRCGISSEEWQLSRRLLTLLLKRCPSVLSKVRGCRLLAAYILGPRVTRVLFRVLGRSPSESAVRRQPSG